MAKFLTSETIRHKDRSQIVSIKTGITTLDKQIIGLNKGEVTCVSGLRGSGKSSWLSQLALQVVDSGHKVALFSGELEASRVLDWLILQAAGRWNTTGHKDYENYFYVKSDEVKRDIKSWLAQKLFVYNNDYGRKVDVVMDSIEECIIHKKVDVVILDNLMTLDLGSTTYDKFDKQSLFMQNVMEFAKKNFVHILVVAHPRKAMGFLRIEDISGTADLTNLVDNVFIVHRVNEDFKRLSKLTLGFKEGSQIYNYTNVIEVCKNRDFGVQDFFVGLQYEKETKRFRNDLYEERRYGWEKEITADTDLKLPFDL